MQEHSTQRWAHPSEDTEGPDCLLSQCSSVTVTNLLEGGDHFLHAQVSDEQGASSESSMTTRAWYF